MWKIDKKIFGNIYVVLILRLLLVYGVYTLGRLAFYLFNLDLFRDVTFHGLMRMLTGGLLFDTSAILYTNLLVILLHILPFRFRYRDWYQQVIKYVFFIVNILAIVANLADAVYYRFTFRRTTTSVFDEFKNEQNGVGLFFRFMLDYWYVTLSVIFLSVLLIWLYRGIKVSGPLIRNPFVYYPVNLVVSAVVVVMCIGGMRGGFAHSTRPITLSNASVYIDKPAHRAIVLNTPFALIRTIGTTILQKVNYFPEAEAEALFSPIHRPAQDSSGMYGKFKGRNVVILIIESFGREFWGCYNKHLPDYSGYTPFLDSLCQHAYVFQQAYSNGRKSIDALPSVIASVPSMAKPFILSHYSGNSLNSPASLLAPEGYHSAFLHGAPNGSMGFDAFVKQAGIQEYYGKDEYNNDADFDGMWGIWDEPFLQYAADVTNSLPQPFVTTTFTLSSHHPFQVPAKYAGHFPAGRVPIHQCVGYTDNALRLFFNKASAMPWFQNTLFVIVADHPSSPYLPEYLTAAGSFAVPMVFYAPGSDLVGNNDSTVVQQCDVLPTVMNLLGYDKEYVSFGNDMFDVASGHFAVNYFNGAFQIIEGGYILQLVEDKVVGLYHLRADRLMEHNLLGQEPAVQKALEDRLKAYIQQYNARLIDNKLSGL